MLNLKNSTNQTEERKKKKTKITLHYMQHNNISNNFQKNFCVVSETVNKLFF